MDYILQIATFFLVSNAICFLYIFNRLEEQDKYLSNHMRGLSDYVSKGEYRPPRMEGTEVKVKKPEVYSPKNDPDTVMSGKIIDPFD